MRYFYRCICKVGPVAAGTLVEYTGERWNRLANESVVRIATAEGAAYPLRRSVFDRSFTKACALRPGQAVHVHALERILADLQPGGPEYTARMCYHHDRDTLLADVAALETFEEMCGYDDGGAPPVKPGEVDALILRARKLVGYTLA